MSPSEPRGPFCCEKHGNTAINTPRQRQVDDLSELLLHILYIHMPLDQDVNIWQGGTTIYELLTAVNILPPIRWGFDEGVLGKSWKLPGFRKIKRAS